MSRETTRARRSARRAATAALLLGMLLIGLSACRGFFGQGPIALMEIDDGGDTELPVVVWFDISGSNDPDGTIASFTLDFGDGSTGATGVDVTTPISHTYLVAGTFTALLTVTDTDGRIDMVNGTVAIGPAMITFAADRSAGFDIYRMQANGAGQSAVLATAYDELFPDLVRGTRDRIAYAAEDGTSWNIWTMTVAGAGRTPLTTQTLSRQIQPSWSFDASTLAYASNAAQTPSATTWEIYTMTAAGTGSTKLTTQSPSWALAPSYSPINGDILFVSGSDGVFDPPDSDVPGTADGGSAIWLWDASEGEAVLLKDGPGRDGDASPSLSGLSVTLSLPTGAGISRPVWSPDGAKIAYAAEASAGGQIDVYVMDADGTDAQTLEDYVALVGTPNANISTTDDEFCPYWLEDGSGIVYAKEDDGGNFQLHKVTFATGAIADLTVLGSNVSPASKR